MTGKKIILIGALFASSLGFSQYCMFFDFKTDNPEAVVTTISKMMNTEWGKNIQGTKGTTHSSSSTHAKIL